MSFKKLLLFLSFLFISCTSQNSDVKLIGKFNAEKDLYLAQFDCKTDVDDIHSAAAVATMLNDPRLSMIKYHAVAGTYGTQEGLYVPANDLFELAFGNKWSDAHTDFDKALAEVTELAVNTLKDEGNIWIAEAGQSDFSAALIKNVKMLLPNLNSNIKIHIVQHSDWNEDVTSTESLTYVKENSDYIKIPDGNFVGNGSPGFSTEISIDIKSIITDPHIITVWEKALKIGDQFNGQEGRYKNEAIAKGGLDFSDASESCWIFGFNELENAEQFFNEFSNKE